MAALDLGKALPGGAMHLRVGRVEKETEWVLDPPHNLRLRRRRSLPPERNEEAKPQPHSRTDPHRSLPPVFECRAARLTNGVRNGRANAPLQSWQRASAATLGVMTAECPGRPLRAPANTSRPRPKEGRPAMLHVANSPPLCGFWQGPREPLHTGSKEGLRPCGRLQGTTVPRCSDAGHRGAIVAVGPDHAPARWEDP